MHKFDVCMYVWGWVGIIALFRYSSACILVFIISILCQRSSDRTHQGRKNGKFLLPCVSKLVAQATVLKSTILSKMGGKFAKWTMKVS